MINRTMLLATVLIAAFSVNVGHAQGNNAICNIGLKQNLIERINHWTVEETYISFQLNLVVGDTDGEMLIDSRDVNAKDSEKNDDMSDNEVDHNKLKSGIKALTAKARILKRNGSCSTIINQLDDTIE